MSSFAPAAVDRSGEIMAQGIMRAGDSITAAIEKHTAETKKLKAYRSMAVDGLGLDPDAVDKMDLPTLEGKMQSLAVRKAMGDMQNAQEDQGFQREAAGREQQNFDYQQQQRTAEDTMMKDPALTGVGPTGPAPAEFTPQSIMGAAGRAGVHMDPEKVMQIMERGKSGKGFWNRADADKPPAEITPGLLRVILGENQSQVVPNMANAGQAVPITGPNGEDLGYGLPTRSGVQPLKTGEVTEKDQFGALTAEKRSLLQAKSRVWNDAEGKNWKPFDDAITQIDARLSELQLGTKKGGGAAAASGAQPQAMPKTKAELKAGGRYQTARGPAKWDGEKFVTE